MIQHIYSKIYFTGDDLYEEPTNKKAKQEEEHSPEITSDIESDVPQMNL